LARANGSGGRLRFLERSALRARGAQPGQRCAEQTVEGSRAKRRFALQVLERGTDLSFAKAEVAQGGEDLGPKIEQLRPHVATILRAVGMADAERAALAPVDRDLAAVGGAVVGSADANDIL